MFKQLNRLRQIVNAGASVLTSYNYKQLLVPATAPKSIYESALTSSDITVKKELCMLADQKQVVMPEVTLYAGLTYEAYHHRPLNDTFWYVVPCMRNERSQRGRLKQFYQLGYEALDSTPAQALEVLLISIDVLKQIKLPYQLEINYLPHADAVASYAQHIREHVSTYPLDGIQKDTLNRNPIRLLDTKDPQLLLHLQKLPPITDVLSADQAQEWRDYLRVLNQLKVNYVVNPFLVRGLDYYQGLVFEIKSASDYLHSQDTVGAGGCYSIKGKRRIVNGVGAALGLDRIAMALDHYALPQEHQQPSCYLYSVAHPYDLILAQRKLQELGHTVLVQYNPQSEKKILKKARSYQLIYRVKGSRLELLEGDRFVYFCELKA